LLRRFSRAGGGRPRRAGVARGGGALPVAGRGVVGGRSLAVARGRGALAISGGGSALAVALVGVGLAVARGGRLAVALVGGRLAIRRRRRSLAVALPVALAVGLAVGLAGRLLTVALRGGRSGRPSCRGAACRSRTIGRCIVR